MTSVGDGEPSAPFDAPAVRLAGVTARRGDRTIWSDGTFDIATGAVVGVIGPNGSGKSTLLALLLGLLEPAAGTIEVLGRSPHRGDRRIGYVPQDDDARAMEAVRCRELVAFGLDGGRWGWRRRSGGERAAVAAALESVGATTYADRRLSQVSGGQRQRVAIAQAVVGDPELLLLDEPLASLDPLARRELLQTLMRSAADGDLTIVLSSHLIVDLERVCDHLVLVATGRTQLAGAIDDLLAEHRLLTGPRPSGAIAGVAAVIDETTSGRQSSSIVRVDGPIHDPRWAEEPLALEELVLAYLSQARGVANHQPRRPLDVVGAAS